MPLSGNLVLASVGALGVALHLHRALRRDSFPILMYHGVVDSDLPVPDWCFVPAEVFRRQMVYLKKHFDVVSLSQAFERMAHGKVANMAVVTFDDGFQNNFDVALPILRELNVPATIFLCTGLVGSRETVWFCRLNEALARSSRSVLNYRGLRFQLAGSEAKGRASAALQSELKKLPPHLLESELRDICQSLGYDRDQPLDQASPFRMLDRVSIGEMCRSGLVDFGAHTASHAILSQLDPGAQQSEIAASVSAVEELTGRKCDVFAYPNGKPDDYTEASIELLKRAGVRIAVTSARYHNRSGTDPLLLGRYGIGDNATGASFRCLVHNWSGPVTRLTSMVEASRRFASGLLARPFRRGREGLSNWLLLRHLRSGLPYQQSSACFELPMSRIVFVCSGNICRSPVAEYYWNQRIRRSKPELPPASSAGTCAVPDRSSPGWVRDAGRSLGLELENHRSAELDRGAVERADAIFVMDLHTYRQLVRSYPEAEKKTHMLGLFAQPPAGEIPDPYNLRPEDAERAYAILIRSIEGLATRMSGRIAIGAGNTSPVSTTGT